MLQDEPSFLPEDLSRMLPITHNEHGMGEVGEVGEAASPASPAKVQKVSRNKGGSGEVSPNVGTIHDDTHCCMSINQEISELVYVYHIYASMFIYKYIYI